MCYATARGSEIVVGGGQGGLTALDMNTGSRIRKVSLSLPTDPGGGWISQKGSPGTTVGVRTSDITSLSDILCMLWHSRGHNCATGPLDSPDGAYD